MLSMHSSCLAQPMNMNPDTHCVEHALIVLSLTHDHEPKDYAPYVYNRAKPSLAIYNL